MDIDQIREYALALGEVEECMPFGHDALVFKTKGKMFLLLSLDSTPLQFNVKCAPEKAVDLRERYTCVLPGYHMNKKHWNTILVNGEADSHQLREWIADSFHLVQNKR